MASSVRDRGRDREEGPLADPDPREVLVQQLTAQVATLAGALTTVTADLTALQIQAPAPTAGTSAAPLVIPSTSQAVASTYTSSPTLDVPASHADTLSAAVSTARDTPGEKPLIVTSYDARMLVNIGPHK
jgi:hypothetical protein